MHETPWPTTNAHHRDGRARSTACGAAQGRQTLLQGIAADHPALLEHSATVGGAASLHGLHT